MCTHNLCFYGEIRKISGYSLLSRTMIFKGPECLSLPVTRAAANILLFFPEKIRLNSSCESSAKQMIHILIHMKCQTLFLGKNIF